MERGWTFPFPCPAFTLQRGCRPVSVLPFIPLGKMGPLWHNERHIGLGLRRTQRPCELSSLSLPGGVVCKQLAGRSTVFQSPSMCPAPWRKQNDSQYLMLTTGLSRNVYTPTFTSTTDWGVDASSRPGSLTSSGHVFTHQPPCCPGFPFTLGSSLSAPIQHP